MHQKGWEQPGTLQKATISHPETSYHFHIGHFSQPSNLIKCPFSKWKTCKYPKLHNSFYLQKIFLGEGGKGSTENSKLGERWELEITFGIVLLLISIDITFNSTNSLQRFLFNAKEKDLGLWTKKLPLLRKQQVRFNLKPPLGLIKGQEWQWGLRVVPPPVHFPLSFLPFFIIITKIVLLRSLQSNTLQFHFQICKVRATSFMRAYIYTHTHVHMHLIKKPTSQVPSNDTCEPHAWFTTGLWAAVVLPYTCVPMIF